MFKRVDTKRDWPDPHLTSRKWLDIPVEYVNIRELIATQDGIYLEPLVNGSTPWGGDKFPHVIKWDNELYLEDGHTRVVRSLIDGDFFIWARVFEIKEDRR